MISFQDHKYIKNIFFSALFKIRDAMKFAVRYKQNAFSIKIFS